MARNVKAAPILSDIDAKVNTQTATLKYHIQLITPMFGGGSEPREPDPVTLVRPSTIRGHLRFWWRATRGANFQNSTELKKREDEIWGSTAVPSPLMLYVKHLEYSSPEKCRKKIKTWDNEKNRYKYTNIFSSVLENENSREFEYCLFPFREEKDKPPASMIISLNFDLIIYIQSYLIKNSFEYKKEVECAVWAWVNFGGLGSRTRRGCGALYCPELAPASEQITQWYSAHRQKYNLSSTTIQRNWPTLPTRIYVKKRPSSTIQAWASAIKILRKFRQIPIGRQSIRSRSYWPEADSLRAITGKGHPNHMESKTLIHPIDAQRGSAFPRAEFGLPIIMHFKKNRDDSKEKNDSLNNCQILPSNANRMTSPLVIRPLAICPAPNEEIKAFPIIITINTVDELLEKGLRLENLIDSNSKLGSKLSLDQDNIQHSRLANYPKSPMANRSAKGSALEAFLTYAQERGFEVVKP
ncbi:MAG: type III-B CRISPR module RAMP protein Cmr1 [Gammaproteobacteria bacterium]